MKIRSAFASFMIVALLLGVSLTHITVYADDVTGDSAPAATEESGSDDSGQTDPAISGGEADTASDSQNAAEGGEAAPADVQGAEQAAPAPAPSESTKSDGAAAQSPAYKAGELKQSGENYTVTLTYGEDAEIPADAKLSVEEIIEDEKDKEKGEDIYTAYLENAAAKVAKEEEIEADSLPYARFFDIAILDKNGAKEIGRAHV